MSCSQGYCIETKPLQIYQNVLFSRDFSMENTGVVIEANRCYSCFYSFFVLVEWSISNFHPFSVKIAVALSNQWASLIILLSSENIA